MLQNNLCKDQEHTSLPDPSVSGEKLYFNQLKVRLLFNANCGMYAIATNIDGNYIWWLTQVDIGKRLMCSFSMGLPCIYCICSNISRLQIDASPI